MAMERLTRDDLAYREYLTWCEGMQVRAAEFKVWQDQTRKIGESNYSWPMK